LIRVWQIEAADKVAARSALDSILTGLTGRPPAFDRMAKGKPYLPAFPRVKFNLSHSKGRALVVIAEDVEVGVDIERIRPMPDWERIAERYLPPGDAEALAEAAAPDREREFFRRWTRAEALWKASGLGLYSAGAVPEGDWHVQDIDAGEGYVAAVAANRAEMPISVFRFGVDQ
jgi:4'-phosphopantetheinyl transferase